MAYKQKGFPMHSVSALKMERPGMVGRKQKDPGMIGRPQQHEMDRLERPEREPMAETRRKKQQGLTDGPVKPPVYDERRGTEVVPSNQVETTRSTSGMPTFNISDLEGVSDKKKSIAYGNIADTPKNQALIQKQQELNEWKNNNPDMSDADFANWQEEMNKIRSQFTHN